MLITGELSINSFIRGVSYTESFDPFGFLVVECAIKTDLITDCFGVIECDAEDDKPRLYGTYNRYSEIALTNLRGELKKQAYNECLEELKDSIKNHLIFLQTALKGGQRCLFLKVGYRGKYSKEYNIESVKCIIDIVRIPYFETNCTSVMSDSVNLGAGMSTMELYDLAYCDAWKKFTLALDEHVKELYELVSTF